LHYFPVIELHPEDDSAIEYVDMDLEQPIEIESTSNISPETATTTLKAAIVSTSPVQEQHLSNSSSSSRRRSIPHWSIH